MVAYGPQPWLADCVSALLDSVGVVVAVVLVDNGAPVEVVDRLAGLARVRVVRPGRNRGFAGGCNLAAEHARTDWLALVNPDAVVAPAALRRLIEAATVPGVGIATADLRLAEQPDLLNSAGNPVHLTGLVWAGGHGRSAAGFRPGGPVAAASGAGLVIGRELWESLGGFAAEYFAYHEDTELSLRVWQRGLRVAHEPDALVLHHYDFARHPGKLGLLERNRLLVVLTTYPAAVLALLAPVLLLTELAMLVLAIAQRWVGQKLAGWWWLARHARWVRQRRARVRGENRIPDLAFAALLTDRLDPGTIAVPRLLRGWERPVRAYWWGARRLLAWCAVPARQPAPPADPPGRAGS